MILREQPQTGRNPDDCAECQVSDLVRWSPASTLPPSPRDIPNRTPGYTRVLVSDEVSDEQWQLSSDVTANGMSQEPPVVLVTSGHWMRCRTCFALLEHFEACEAHMRSGSGG